MSSKLMNWMLHYSENLLQLWTTSSEDNQTTSDESVNINIVATLGSLCFESHSTQNHRVCRCATVCRVYLSFFFRFFPRSVYGARQNNNFQITNRGEWIYGFCGNFLPMIVWMGRTILLQCVSLVIFTFLFRLSWLILNCFARWVTLLDEMCGVWCGMNEPLCIDTHNLLWLILDKWLIMYWQFGEMISHQLDDFSVEWQIFHKLK